MKGRIDSRDKLGNDDIICSGMTKNSVIAGRSPAIYCISMVGHKTDSRSKFGNDDIICSGMTKRNVIAEHSHSTPSLLGVARQSVIFYSAIEQPA